MPAWSCDYHTPLAVYARMWRQTLQGLQFRDSSGHPQEQALPCLLGPVYKFPCQPYAVCVEGGLVVVSPISTSISTAMVQNPQ